ncbi:MAG: hypothetical protein JNL19_08110 [Burkholderiales bacterium]|nr:hypothetical protein [Burkholderiales bacterium]
MNILSRSTSTFVRTVSRVIATVVAATTIATLPAHAQSVTVVEYYNSVLDAYFITGRTNEQSLLDGVADFKRTGMTFQATATASATSTQVRICRFYVSASSPFTSSHFYGRDGVDCQSLRNQNLAGFTWEDYDFATQQPTNNTCPANTTPIYRGFRAAANGKTSNHRYTASSATYQTAINAGYLGENIAFCATSATAASSTPVANGTDCGTFYYGAKTITYQSTSSVGTGATSFTRTYDATPVSFNGYTATRVLDTSSNGVSATMIEDGSASWRELGGRSTSSSGPQDTYSNPPITYPKAMTVGQSINVNRTVVFSPANPLGNPTQTGSIVLTARESVTVPAGTFANACKFTIQIATTYPSLSSSTTTTLTWVVPGVGMVRSEVTDSTTVFGQTVSTTATVAATSIQ